jgi:hypothetical protein
MKPEVKVPESVEALLWRVLAKSPADRPDTAEQMIAELDAAEASVRAVESGLRLTLPTLERSRVRGHRAWLAALALAVLALLLVAIVGSRRTSSNHSAATSAEPGVMPATTSQNPTQPSDSAPSPSLSSLENSSEAPSASPAASAPAAPPAKRVAHPHGATLPLEKKGNERYGRFN